MSTFDLNSINSALAEASLPEKGVDFSEKSLKLDTAKDAQPIVDAINACKHLHYLTLKGNTLGVQAAEAISKALERHPELKVANFSDMFTGRMKTEIPPALSALGEGMIIAGARLSVLDLSDNAFGPIGVEGLTRLLQSNVCSELEELRLNNNGLGITGGQLLAKALTTNPRKLKIFIAGRNRLENDGAIALSKVFKEMGTLEEIAMPQNGIYHPGVKALSDAFAHNPNLRCLNLNDNTIAQKGASAIAAVMPKLKNLKSINFGDCLLKSRGASALARGIKNNAIPLESIDLSFNEIAQDACMEVVVALLSVPGAADRLARVKLSGNNFTSAGFKKDMKEKLGPCAELSDGSEGESDYSINDSDLFSEEAEEDEESSYESYDYDGITPERHSESENSAPEDLQHSLSIFDLGPEMPAFIANPTLENMQKLGPRALELVELYIKKKVEPADVFSTYVELIFCFSGLSEVSPLAMEIAEKLYGKMMQKAHMKLSTPWMLTNSMLRGLGLIKSENKDEIRWNTAGCFLVLAKVIDNYIFLPAIRDTLRFFISSQLQKLPDKEIVMKYPVLYQEEQY